MFPVKHNVYYSIYLVAMK